MPTAATLNDLDLILRGGVAGLLILVAAILMRDHWRRTAARLGVLFALSGAAHAITGSPGVCGQVGPWTLPLVMLSTGGNVAFWLFASALFEDGFKLRPIHAVIWTAVVAVGSLQGLVLVPSGSPYAVYVAGLLTLETLFFVGLASGQILAARAADLVEPRRRLRLQVVATAAGYIALRALSDLSGARQAFPAAASLIDALALALVAAVVALALLGLRGGEAMFGSASQPRPAAPPEDAEAAQALDHAMRVERAYRQDGLTIGALAAQLGLTEHRLRRLINQGLGWRNFNAFLNSWRIAEAKAALADPTQAEVPILTIALDAGFASLGPFNRAFKAETGVTPSEYRRAESGIGEA